MATNSLFNEKTLARGTQYFQAGRVVELRRGQKDPGEYSGAVQGSEVRPYWGKLNFDLVGEQMALVRNSCDCPVGTNCKHIVALCLAIEAAVEERGDVPIKAVLASSTPPAHALVPASPQAWLEAMQGVLSEDVSCEAGKETMPHSGFAYILQPHIEADATAPLASVTLRLGKLDRRLRKNLQSQSFRPLEAKALWEALYESPADAGITGLLNAAFPPRRAYDPSSAREHGNERMLGDPVMAPLVSALVASGRCSWEEGGEPLRKGPDRQAALMWRPSPDGRVRLALAIAEDTLVLGTLAPLYVDRRSARVGALRTLVPQAVLGALATAPWLTLPEAEAFLAKVPAALQRLLPAPQAAKRVQQAEPLQPKLTLRVVPGGQGASPELASQLAGTLCYAYGEHELPYGSADTEICSVSADGQVVFFERQRQAEQQATDQAEALGLAFDVAGNCAVGPASTQQELYSLCASVLRPLQQAGWRVLGLPMLEQKLVHADGPVQVQASDSETGVHWFNVELSIDVEGKRQDLVSLLAHALVSPNLGLDFDNPAAMADVIYLPSKSGQVIAVNKQRLMSVWQLVLDLAAGNGDLGLSQAAALNALMDTGEIALGGSSQALDLVRRLSNFKSLKMVAAPKALCAQLRDYQRIGITWLGFLRQYSLGGILADDMGLGKTIQVIAHMLRCKQLGKVNGPFLVVAPTGLMGNWQSELTRFAPTLRQAVYHGLDRSAEVLSSKEVILTTYGIVAKDEEIFAAHNFDTVILDESQTIKNPRSAMHKGARSLQADHRICLSGTPVQNNLEELWAQFAFCMPNLLGNHRAFHQNVVKRMSSDSADEVKTYLNQRTKPFMLRRQKKEVAPELPDKTEILERVVLGRRQADLYESVRSLMDERVREEIGNRGMAKSTIVILAALLKLRQVCCDPRLLKLPRLPTGMQSAKLVRLLELATQLMAEGRTILIFSQFTSMLSIISESLNKAGLSHLTLTGKTKDRSAVTNAFQAGKAPIMLISLKAGGVGLNLTAADTVIHYDPWWNPAAENQATDRAHRIGQRKAVHVYKLIVAGSLEEKIVDMQRDKQRLSDQVMDEGTMVALSIREDIENIFAPLPTGGDDNGTP